MGTKFNNMSPEQLKNVKGKNKKLLFIILINSKKR